jgi:hypothetical protein
MNEADLRALWASIQMIDMKLITSENQPLWNLEPCLQSFGLDPLSLPALSREVAPEVFSKDASFKESSDAILLSLRQCLYDAKEMPSVSNWADKLMRFCEIRLPSLRQRAVEKCGSRNAANLLMLQVSAFMLDYALYSKDARYLNTVLKLADLRWVVDERSIPRKLNGNPQDVASALFQFRVLLVIEYAMRKLSGEGML